MSMLPFQREFIDLALSAGALKFGDFTLKSGRKSPYFFNTGAFRTGDQLNRLGRYYAQAIAASGLDFDMLYGAAYKGIPLVTAAAMQLATQFQRDCPFVFNRKVMKDHGEGGWVVGGPIRGQVLMIDDVISAGTSVRESAEIIAREGGQLAGVVLALDRQEVGQRALSAVEEVRQTYGVPVISILSLDMLMVFLADSDPQLQKYLPLMTDYWQTYCVRKDVE